MKRSLFSFLICCIVPVLSMAQINRMHLSYRSEAPTWLVLADSCLSVSDADTCYRHACLKIDEVGYSEFTPVRNGSCRFKLPALAPGRYEMVLFLGKEPSGQVWGYVDKGFYLRISPDGTCFDLPQQVLEVNRAVCSRGYYPERLLAATSAIPCDDERIRSLSLQITGDAPSNYAKVQAVHDYVATHIYYDFDAYYSHRYGPTDAIGVLESRKSVCQGYANLCAALLRAAGIPCDVVSGYGLGIGTTGKWDDQNVAGPSNHAWNFAYPDNRLVIFDATWDSDLEFRNGSFNFNRGLRGYRYFDLTPEALSLDHRLIP